MTAFQRRWAIRLVLTRCAYFEKGSPWALGYIAFSDVMCTHGFMKKCRKSCLFHQKYHTVGILEKFSHYVHPWGDCLWSCLGCTQWIKTSKMPTRWKIHWILAEKGEKSGKVWVHSDWKSVLQPNAPELPLQMETMIPSEVEVWFNNRHCTVYNQPVKI